MAQRTDHSGSEQAKRHRLLHALHRRGTASRLHLARELRISNSRVCDLVERMVEQGLLREEMATAGGERRGRRGVSVGLNPRFGHLLGFDMEAKRLRLVVCNFAGEIVWELRRALQPLKDRQALVDAIFSFIDDSLAQIRPKFPQLLGFGLAASGVIDSRRGVILHYDLIPQATNLPLRDLIAAHVKLPTVMENNIRAMTLAEWTLGAARGMNSFVCMAVRSGVGAGVVLNGRLLTGSHGFCGETGYMVLPTGGRASGWKNLQQTVSESAMGIDIEAAGFGIPPRVARRAGELIGSQLASIAALLDPEAIILGGSVLNTEGPVWPHVLSAFRTTALHELVERVQILPARLGSFAAAQGAAYRCLYELFPVTAVH
ncbi:MAG TPA: ROK family transcriptional regulator [Tepidisphaeraceae bacterium]|nr:ROK family transcriptional regulator [Tepidisphaeraceae bacterium]